MRVTKKMKNEEKRLMEARSIGPSYIEVQRRGMVQPGMALTMEGGTWEGG